MCPHHDLQMFGTLLVAPHPCHMLFYLFDWRLSRTDRCRDALDHSAVRLLLSCATVRRVRVRLCSDAAVLHRGRRGRRDLPLHVALFFRHPLRDHHARVGFGSLGSRFGALVVLPVRARFGRGGVDLGVEGVVGDGTVGVGVEVAHFVGAASCLSLDLQDAELLTAEVSADLVQVRHHRQLVRDGQQNHVSRLQQTRDTQAGKTIVRLRGATEI